MRHLFLLVLPLTACTTDPGTDSGDGDSGDSAADTGDTGDTGCATPLPWYADADGDGFGDVNTAVTACEAPAGHVADATDCDDAAAAVHPDATEVYCNDVDEDCSGAADLPGLWVPGDHATLQAAVDAAASGSTVCVDAGQADKALTVDRGEGFTVTILGAGADATALVGTGATRVLSGDVEVRDLTVRSDGEGFVVGAGGTLGLVDVQVDGAGCGTYCGGYVAWVEGALDATGLVVGGVDMEGEFTSSVAMFHAAWGSSVSLTDFRVEGNRVDTSGTEITEGPDTWWQGYAENDGVIGGGGGTVSLLDGVIVDNEFRSSRSQVYMLGYDVEGTIRGVEVTGNAATSSDGEAIFLYAGGRSLTISQTMISDNVLTGPGVSFMGAESADLVVENVVVAGNVLQADADGSSQSGGWFWVGWGTGALTNVTFADNRIDEDVYVWGGGLANLSGASLSLTSSAFVDLTWGGDRPLVYSDTAAPAVAASFFHGNSGVTYEGAVTGTIEASVADPRFVDAAGRDYHLAEGSPLIDAGAGGVQDADGSACDVGGFGGPEGSGW